MNRPEQEHPTEVHDPRAMRDPHAIRALSHPLRLRLSEVLGTRELATATECARATGQSVAGGSSRGMNTSSMGRGPTYWRQVHGTHWWPDQRPRLS